MPYDLSILFGFLGFGFVWIILILLITPDMRQSLRNSWYVSKIKKEMRGARKAQQGMPDIPECEDEEKD